MASLPHHYPQLSLHLADRSLTPLVTSSSPSSSSPSSSSRHDALARLASSALGVHDAASRLGLGAPQRVLVEYGPRGPLLIQTFLDPATAGAIAPRRPGRQWPAPAGSSNSGGRRAVNGDYDRRDDGDQRAAYETPHTDDQAHDNETEPDALPPDVPPMLLGVIIAPSPDEYSSARRATVRLERIGRQIQESWVAEGGQPRP
ncbi:hypothetical protein GGTG_06235 [Gaeumannomyces tritici R3-111a-1]|uniref:Uncharacterized protein n=1 Tax=Gaeumannomyces tritici (strain R3-111a-1) TaxID=644352 RepID=J3NY82_GAET3|nr:hypothetical protein GGTG_06235 [Gaeumannomyces tritici R3-111a-1]EJT76315.1 hypothetical protein GGTG_06235 [Gaeumannomyces tritici R3-111a-1]